MKRISIGALVMTIWAFLPQQALAEKTAASDSAPARPSAQITKINRDAKVLIPDTTERGDAQSIFAAKQPRLILALGGGACKSIAEIGVMRSLERHHIAIDGIVGTSLGSTIGALYCAGICLDDIEKMFLDKSIQKSILSGSLDHYLFYPFAPIKNMVVGKPYAGILNGHAYLHFLQKKLPPSFSDLKLPFAAVATNLTDGQTCVFAKGNLPQAVLASSAVPRIFKPVVIDGKLYVDGGLKANLPATIAQTLGADVVVAVLCDKAIAPEANKRFQSGNNIILRVADIMMAASDHKQSADADVLIYPNVDFVPMMTTNPRLIKRAIAAGELACDQVLAKITDQLAAGRGNVNSAKSTSMKNTESISQ